MTSSYGIGGKPYMGVPGHGNMGVGPVVRPPLGSNNGGRLVDATFLRESTDRFVKPNPTVKPPTPKTGMFGGRMAGLFRNPVAFVRGLFGPAAIAQSTGLYLAEKELQSLGRPGAASMSLLGGDAPVRRTPFNSDVSDEVIEANSGRTQTDRLMGKPIITQADSDADKPTPEQLESIFHHPELTGPKGNEVGSDADPDTPGLQGSGAPGANPYEPGSKEHGMFIWAQKHKGMAQDVLDKVEKRGLKQAGYTSIREALGQTPTTPPASVYKGETELTDVEFEAPELKSDAKIDFNSGFNVSQDAKDFAAGAISALKTSASSLQQPNFDGTSQPIGGDSPTDPQPVQDFNNANSNPAEVVGYLGHPLNKQPSAEAEAANAEYGAMKFEFDPVKNMMVRVK